MVFRDGTVAASGIVGTVVRSAGCLYILCFCLLCMNGEVRNVILALLDALGACH